MTMLIGVFVYAYTHTHTSTCRFDNTLAFVASTGWVFRAYHYVHSVAIYTNSATRADEIDSGLELKDYAYRAMLSIPITFIIAFTLYPLFGMWMRVHAHTHTQYRRTELSEWYWMDDRVYILVVVVHTNAYH
jgi:hypothetical protein